MMRGRKGRRREGGFDFEKSESKVGGSIDECCKATGRRGIREKCEVDSVWGFEDL